MEWLWKENFKLHRRPLHVENLKVNIGSDDANFQNSSANHEQASQIIENKHCFHSVVSELLTIEQDFNRLEIENENETYKVIMWSKDLEEGYEGVAYFVPSICSVVIINYLECTKENLLRRFYLMSKDRYNRHSINLAATFVQLVINRMTELKLNYSTNLVITGYQLGGWLAQIAYLSSSYLCITDNVFQNNNHRQELPSIHCVVFDSPGCLEEITYLKEHYCINWDDLPPAWIYLTAPDLLNTLGHQWEHLYRIFPQLYTTFSIKHPHNEQIELSTTSTDMNVIHTYLKEGKSNNILKIHQWPAISYLDYRDVDSIQKLGIRFVKEAANEKEGIQRIEKSFDFCGMRKYYCVGDGPFEYIKDPSYENKRFLQNVYLRFSNSKLISLFTLVDNECVKKLKILDPLKTKLINADVGGHELIISPLPKGSYVHFRSYNMFYNPEKLEEVVNFFKKVRCSFVIDEFYKSTDNEECCAAILKSDGRNVILMSGLNSDYVNRKMKNSDEIRLEQLVLPDAVAYTQHSNSINMQGNHIFEYLCRNYCHSSIIWLHAVKNKLLLKGIYDDCYRIKRNYNNHNIRILLDSYDSILLYGEAGSGKTNEIFNIITHLNAWVIYIRIIELTNDDIDELKQAFFRKNVEYLVKRFFFFHETDEALIRLVLEKCLYSSNGSKDARIIICFDGLDLLNGGEKQKNNVNDLLIYLKNKTRAQLIITARHKTDYLGKIEKMFPSQSLAIRKMEKLKECDISNILTTDCFIASRSLSKEVSSCSTNMSPSTLYKIISNTIHQYIPFLSTCMILEGSIAYLRNVQKYSNAVKEPDNTNNFFEAIVDNHVDEILMENKSKFSNEEESSSFIYALKQFTFGKFQHLIFFERKVSRSSTVDKTTDKYLSFWKYASDCIIEFLYVQTYLDAIFNKSFIIIPDPFGYLWNGMMSFSEFYGARDLFNVLLCDKEQLFIKPEDHTQEESNDDRKKTALINLIQENRMNIIRFFLHLFGENALHIAAEVGSEEAAHIFINLKRCMMSVKLENGYTPLHNAAVKGHEKVVAKLLNEGANCGGQDNDGNTPLHLAVKKQFVTVVQQLLKKNETFINLKNNSGDTSLNIAVKFRSDLNAVNIIEYLLDRKADIEEPNLKYFTPLLTAVHSSQFYSTSNNLKVLQILTRRGASISAISKCGLSAIHYAAGNDSIDIIKYLMTIDQEILKAKSDKLQFTALHIAAANNCITTVKFLLDHGSDVNVTDFRGRIPLHFAASMGRIDIVQYLVQKGSKLNKLCSLKYSPIHLAAKNGRYAIVEYLMNQGADLHTVNFKGLTPIKSAANNIRFKTICTPSELLDTIRIFLKGKKFNINSEQLLSFGLRQNLNFPDWLINYLIEKTDADSERSKEGFHSIHFAAYRGDVSMIEKLKNKIKSTKFDINALSIKRYTPLCISVAMKSDKEMNDLLQWNANDTIPDENGITPFHLACYYGKLTMVDTLANRNKELVNLLTNKRSTPLHLAADSGHCDVVSLLIRKGAKLHVSDTEHYTPLHIAAYFGRLDIVQIMVHYSREITFLDDQTSDKSTSLNLAARRGKYEIVKLLLDNGANGEIADCKGYTPLHNAAYHDHHRIVQLLLKMLGSKIVNVKTSLGSTPLFLAVKQNNYKSVLLLLDSGANVNDANKHGITPLHLAALLGYTKILDILIEHNANVNVEDKIGRTPLFLASMNSQSRILELLIEKGADILKAQSKGWTPIHAAAYESQFDNVVLLGQKGGVECINSRTKAGDVALHFAAWNGNLNLIKWLVQQTEHGVENNFKITPTDLAVSQGYAHPDKCSNQKCQKCFLYSYLLDNGQHLNYLNDFEHLNKIEYEVMRKGTLNTVEYLETELNADFLVNIPKSKRTPIHAAAEFDRTEILMYLHKRNYNLNITIPILNETPLYVAVVEGKFASVKTLIELGADINLGDKNGWGPLHAAVFKNNPEIVEYLCRIQQCQVNAGTNFDMTPLYIGIQYKSLAAVEKLFERLVDPTICDQSGWNPLKVAEYNLEQLELNSDEHGTTIENEQSTREILDRIKDYTENWCERKSVVLSQRRRQSAISTSIP